MEHSLESFLGTESIGKLMKKYSLPCIISLLVGALYNIVDRIFIANSDYLGAYGNAANIVVFPMTVIALAIAVMIGDGCCAFVSISLGQNDVNSARRSVGYSFLLSVLCGVILCAVYLIFQDGIITLFGAANESVYYTQFAIKVFRIYLCMLIPACVNKACFIFLQAMGKAKESASLSMVREIVFGVEFAILLPIFFALDGVLYSMPVSNILTFLAFLYLIVKTFRELKAHPN